MSPGLWYYVFLFCLSFLLSFLPLFPYFSPPSRRSSHIHRLSSTNIVFIVRSNQGLYSTSTDRGFLLLLLLLHFHQDLLCHIFFFFPLAPVFSSLLPILSRKSFLFIEPIKRSVYSKYSYYRYSSKQILFSPSFFCAVQLDRTRPRSRLRALVFAPVGVWLTMVFFSL